MQANSKQTVQPRGWKRILPVLLFCAAMAQAQTITPLADFNRITGAAGDAFIQGLDGNFYGAAGVGGARDRGAVIVATPSGTITDLFSFCKAMTCPTGAGPYLSLLQVSNGDFFGFTSGTTGILGSDGNFYGTTANPTSDGAIPNTIFQITPAGVLTVLYSTDVRTQSGVMSVLQSTDGNFYATNDVGGANNLGTFFKISTGLSSFVRALRPYGFIGQTAYIMGTGLTGSTNVTFNGTPATTFSVVSDSEITAVIPTGSTSGALQVVTPGGTLSGVVPFQVFQ